MKLFKFVLAERRTPTYKCDEPGNAYDVYDRETGTHMGHVVRWWTNTGTEFGIISEWGIVPADSDAYEHYEIRRDDAGYWLRQRWLEKKQ